ncbi:MAG: undecaprenyldiphospho-muramoylpentapeptide beta-N-acetylglucosaminyltransferase [Clostridiales bacterium 43-6]|nr:MAG: undecaprenyldiphospho-muramoylpentapeptide beta-N-acetylglucosaminyltransferase [Clostridiales bacterium 43-6]
MHILFAAGGTAGHINPAISVAQYIRKQHHDAVISFIGNKNGMESSLVPKAGFDFYSINVAGFQRKLTMTNIKRNISAVIKVLKSSSDCEKLLQELKPDVVVGTGGYVSGPVLRKAAKMGIKTAAHEQNAFPGITTKMLCKSVDKVMLAFEDAKKHIKTDREFIVTGNPVRQSLIDADRETSRQKLGLDERPMILSYGGSLGARRVNEAIADVLKWHAASGKYYHFHAIGKYGGFLYELLDEAGVVYQNSRTIRIREYIDDMDICMSAADVVIARAGAITLSELQVTGKAAILIPSPNVAENHQYHNALSISKKGGAVLIEEKDLTGERLIEELKKLIENPKLIQLMGKKVQSDAVFDSNERIYEVIMDLYNT